MSRLTAGFVMFRKIFLVFLLLVPATSVAQEQPYQLNPGDVLQISVWKEDGLERDVLVLPDGTISFPLAGHVMAAGRSAMEIQNDLAKKMEKFIPDLAITVSVRNLSGYKVYVIGQVNRPGEFLPGRRIDVMQALSSAGGLTAFADDDDIVILRRKGGKQVALPFDYDSVKRGKKLGQNVILESGDVVVVSD
jgi:polysaccharide export outer membrane protein